MHPLSPCAHLLCGSGNDICLNPLSKFDYLDLRVRLTSRKSRLFNIILPSVALSYRVMGLALPVPAGCLSESRRRPSFVNLLACSLIFRPSGKPTRDFKRRVEGLASRGRIMVYMLEAQGTSIWPYFLYIRIFCSRPAMDIKPRYLRLIVPYRNAFLTLQSSR